jgi:hypothetical protein
LIKAVAAQAVQTAAVGDPIIRLTYYKQLNAAREFRFSKDGFKRKVPFLLAGV